jgi:hypothetical protein
MKLLFFAVVSFMMAVITGDRALAHASEAANQAQQLPTQSKPKIRIIQPTLTTSSPTIATMTSLQGSASDDSSSSNNNNNNNKFDRFPFLGGLRRNYQHQPVFLQAVEEMAINLEPLFSDPTHGEFYQRAFVVMTEPERTISFRVPWEDDEGNMQYNRGWRVEFNR